MKKAKGNPNRMNNIKNKSDEMTWDEGTQMIIERLKGE